MAEFKAKSAAEVVEAVLDEIMEDAGVLVSQCRNARSTMESRAQDKAAARKKIAYRLKPFASQTNLIEAQARRIEDLEAESAELTKALTGLTCGGSEFFVRRGERFVADIPACVEWVRRRDRNSFERAKTAMLRVKELEALLTPRAS